MPQSPFPFGARMYLRITDRLVRRSSPAWTTDPGRRFLGLSHHYSSFRTLRDPLLPNSLLKTLLRTRRGCSLSRSRHCQSR